MSGEGQKFVLSGCKNYNSVTNALSHNVLHLEANDINNINDNSKVNLWSSKVSSNGNTYNLSTNSSNGPLLKTIDGQKFLEFTGSTNEVLENAQFNGLENAEKFTRIVVFKPTATNYRYL